MSKTVDTFKVTLTGDASQLARTMQKVSKNFEKLGRKMRTIGIGMTAALTAPLALVGKNFLDAASDAEEMTAKFNAVFGENANQVGAWAESYGNAIGRSTSQLMEMASSVQDTFVPMGFARGEAAEMSKTLTTLAVDVASFNNKLDDDVMRDFQSALVGNTETVRKYGIVITQSVLNQELLNMGIAGGVKNATEAEKVQGRLNLIMKGTTDAQGDAIRTADSYANQVKSLKGEFKELAEQMGNILMPIAAKVVGWAKDAVTWFKGLDDGTKLMIVTLGGLAAALGPAILGLSAVATALAVIFSPMGLIVAGIAALGLGFILFRDEIMTAMRPIAEIVDKWLVKPFVTGLDFLHKKVSAFVSWYLGVWSSIADFVGLDTVSAHLDSVSDALAGWADSERTVFAEVIDVAVGAGGSVIDALQGRFGQVLEDFKSSLGAAYESVAGVGVGEGGTAVGGNGGDAGPLVNDATKSAAKVGDAFKNAFSGAGSAMADFFKDGKDGFDSLKQWAAGAADKILNNFMDLAISGLFNAVAPGVGGLFGGGGKAGGGRISAPTLVGERGPEIFNPGGAGTIHNAADTRRMLGGGGGPVTIHMTNRFDVGLESVEQRIAAAAPQIARATEQGIMENISRGGAARRMVRS